MPGQRPQRETIPIQQPTGGMNTDKAFSEQPPTTSRLMQNVRLIDPTNGRQRISQRSGLEGAPLANRIKSPYKVSAMAQVTRNEMLLSYTTATGTALELAGPFDDDIVDAVTDSRGHIYCLGRLTGFAKYSPQGTLITQHRVPLAFDTGQLDKLELRKIAVDSLERVYVCASRDNTAGASSTQAEARMWRFDRNDPTVFGDLDEGYHVQWELDSGNFFQGVEVIGTNFATIEWDEAGGTGYLKLYVNSTNIVPEEIASLAIPEVPMDFKITADYQAYIAFHDPSFTPAAADEKDLQKWSIAGESLGNIWRMNGMGATYSPSYGGVGLSVDIGPNGEIYSTGPRAGSAGSGQDVQDVRRVVDNGSTFSTTGDAWNAQFALTLNWIVGGNFGVRIRSDQDGVLYVPYGLGGTPIKYGFIYEPDGTLVQELEDDGGGWTSPRTIIPASTKPTYDDPAIKTTEYVWLAGLAGVGPAFEALRRINLVSATITNQTPPRSVCVVGVAGPAIRKGDVGDVDAPGQWRDITGSGTVDPLDAFDDASPYVSMVSAFGKVYIADGVNYRVYDPNEDVANYGVVNEWTASRGEIPPRLMLWTLWRGRMVGARDPEDPHNWYMSALGDPLNFEFFPELPSVTQAVSANNSRIGRIPDIVNSMIPYNDDVLIFGGDRTIWMLSGDPVAGGQLDLVTEDIGIGFGVRVATKDPMGNLYFWTSRGGVAIMRPGQIPVRLTRDRIEREMQDLVNLETHYVELVWNYRDEGLHVIPMPYDKHTAQQVSWFWDQKNDAWMRDTYSVTGEGGVAFQPTAALLFDGDGSDDNRLFLGMGTSFAFQVSGDRWNDAGEPIESEWLYGPLVGSHTGREFRFSNVQVDLGTDEQDRCTLEGLVSDTADAVPDEPLWQHELGPGRNPFIKSKARGGAFWLRFSNSGNLERWAMDRGSIEVVSAGRVRRRT